MTKSSSTIVWFRQDLRVSDNAALHEASQNGTVIPVYIIDETDRPLGGASKWWLHHSLAALRDTLGGLVIAKGNPEAVLSELVSTTDATGIYWNRMYEPHAISRDKLLKAGFKEAGIDARSFRGSVLREPWTVETGSGQPYKVYSPYWKALQASGFDQPLPAIQPELANLSGLGEPLEEFNLLPATPDWAAGWSDMWRPGEAGARTRFDTFIAEGLAGYGKLRDRPDLPNVSRLSPHIHFGEISPLQMFSATDMLIRENPTHEKDAQKFRSEIAWRDFANHLLFHFPSMVERNWKSAFDNYPWREDTEQLERWQKGQTGYPMVDAGMRELWHTGYMHNRIRMLVASFLVKHLRIHWQHGEAWFWDTLLDADLANNVASWQWVTGSGADAAPYFRIFNPFTQGLKFDPDGAYVRKWCPELSALPNKYIHTPHEAPKEVLSQAGVTLGTDYPLPMVDHKKAREAALAGYEHVKLGGQPPAPPSTS